MSRTEIRIARLHMKRFLNLIGMVSSRVYLMALGNAACGGLRMAGKRVCWMGSGGKVLGLGGGCGGGW